MTWEPNSRLALVLAALLLLAGCSTDTGVQQPTPQLEAGLQKTGTSAQAPTQSAASPRIAEPGQRFNPRVSPPQLSVEVAPDLVADEPPPGSLTAAKAQEKAINVMRASSRSGVLRLTALRWDEPNHNWKAEFATPDGRSAAAPRSHPAPVPTGNPMLDRKQVHSWYTVTDAVTLVLDGSSGEVRGGGYRGGSVQPDRLDLEHYLGRIISGGEETRLQLIHPDGSPAGRVVTVILPDSLFGDDLALWQVWYGTGRELEVWGLTGAEGVVVAHKIAMPDPPSESLLANALVRGLPLCRECRMESAAESEVRFVSPDSSPESLQAWYRSHLPEYGWEPTGLTDQFASAAGPTWNLRVKTYSEGAAVTFIQVDSAITFGH